MNGKKIVTFFAPTLEHLFLCSDIMINISICKLEGDVVKTDMHWVNDRIGDIHKCNGIQQQHVVG